MRFPITIAAQLDKFPDLAEVVTQLQTREEDSFTKELRGVVAASSGEGWSVYSNNPPSSNRREVMRHYGVFRYEAEVGCFVPTLNQIVEQTRILVPAVQRAYIAGRDELKSKL